MMRFCSSLKKRLLQETEECDIVKEGIYGVLVKLESASTAPPTPADPVMSRPIVALPIVPTR